MSRLNPLSAADRRITAYTNTFEISTFPNGDVLVGIYSYDCWNRMQGGLFKQRRTADLFKQTQGFKSFVTLKLMKRGCCPIITQELAEIAKESSD